jgi:acyl-CoA dehydrogenase
MGSLAPAHAEGVGRHGARPDAMAAVSAEAAKVSIGPFVINAQAPDEGNQHTLLHWGPTSRRRST